MSKEADALYDEMCCMVGQAVRYLCDNGLEINKHNIANVLDTTLPTNNLEQTEQMRKAIEAAFSPLTRH